MGFGHICKFCTTHPLNTIILEEEVKYLINKVKYKAPGPTDINKDIATHLPQNIKYMKTLHNASLATGHFPRLFNHTHAIFKYKHNKNPQHPNSYRPIALLKVFGKMLEKLVNKRLKEHLVTNQLLPDHIYGFRKNKNTQTPTILTLNSIQNDKYNK